MLTAPQDRAGQSGEGGVLLGTETEGGMGSLPEGTLRGQAAHRLPVPTPQARGLPGPLPSPTPGLHREA